MREPDINQIAEHYAAILREIGADEEYLYVRHAGGKMQVEDGATVMRITGDANRARTSMLTAAACRPMKRAAC